MNTQQGYGIQSRSELGTYSREFRRISSFLLGKNRISGLERDKLYVSGFDMQLRDKVLIRLQYMQPMHYPDDPYDWEAVNECADFLLAGTPAAGSPVPSRSAPPTAAPAAPGHASGGPIAPTRVKAEPQHAAAIEDFETRMERNFATMFSQAYTPRQIQQYVPPTSHYAPESYAPQSDFVQQPTHRPTFAPPSPPVHQQQQEYRRPPPTNDALMQLTSGMNLTPPTVAPTVRDLPPPMPIVSSQMLEIVESLHTAVSAEDCEADDELYEVLQEALRTYKDKKARADASVPTRPEPAVPPTPIQPPAFRDAVPEPTSTSPQDIPPSSSLPMPVQDNEPRYKCVPLRDKPAAVIPTIVRRVSETPIAVPRKEFFTVIRSSHQDTRAPNSVAAFAVYDTPISPSPKPPERHDTAASSEHARQRFPPGHSYTYTDNDIGNRLIPTSDTCDNPVGPIPIRERLGRPPDSDQ